MLKKYFTGLLCLASAVLAAAPINVKTCGAVGDGVTDDTNAIQTALNKVAHVEQYDCVAKMGGSFGGGYGGEGPYGEVYFPKGTYKITRTLVYPPADPQPLRRKLVLRGESGAVIEQSNPDADLLYFSAMRLWAYNLGFKGGKVQLRVWTNNGDASPISCDGCTFEDATDCSIWARIPALYGEGGSAKLCAPYTIAWKDALHPVLTPTAQDDLEEFWNSTIMEILNCTFKNNACVADASCDMMLFRDCTVETPAQQKGAVFRMMNLLFITGMKAVGSGDAADEPCWITFTNTTENKAFLNIDNSSFRVREGASGMCLVRTDVHPGYGSPYVRVANTTVEAGGCAEGGIIACEPYTAPNMISLRNVTEAGKKRIKAVNFGANLTAEDMERLRYTKDWPLDLSFSYTITGCSSNVDATLPPGPKGFEQKALPAGTVEKLSVAPVEFSFNPDERFAKRMEVKSLRNLGVDQDCTREIEAAMKKAAKSAPITLVLPSRNIRISRTIKVPDNVRIAANGCAYVFAGEDFNAPLFEVKGNRCNVFEGIYFAGGTNAVKIDANAEGEYLFTRCNFADSKEVAILARRASESDKSKLKITRGTFLGNMHAVDADLAHKEITSVWIMNDGRMTNSAQVVNRGGELLHRYNMHIPILPKTEIGNGRQPVAKFKDKDWGMDVRWLDNYGKLHALGDRFGGEFCGMALCYNFAETGTILIQEGFSYQGNLYCLPVMLFAEKAPKAFVVEDLLCSPDAVSARGCRSGIMYRAKDGKVHQGRGKMNVLSSGILFQAPWEAGK